MSITPQIVAKQRLVAELSELEKQIKAELRSEQHPLGIELLKDLEQHLVSFWPDLTKGHLYWPLQKSMSRLEAVLAALSQVELNMYGICADCEQNIEPERLLHDPATQRCSRCQALFK